MTNFAHFGPHGAAVLEDGTVRFRLWAPGRPAIRLAIEGGDTLPMMPEGEGWFGLTTERAKAGSLYRFVLEDDTAVPDPASRFQPEDVHGPSEVIDPRSYAWRQADWRGRPWHETVVYELHVGAFSPRGTYAGVEAELGRLRDLGVTAIEIMPLSDTPGRHNWGYDGVLPYAPDSANGRPDELKRLIDAAHEHGLMVMLDVVYNHFGPDGNYLSLYAPNFFDPSEHTPWGAAVNFKERAVRDFVIHNALYWLMEYRFDGLRLDAVHALIDDDDGHILKEIASTIRKSVEPGRQVHLVLENETNDPERLVRDDEGRSVFYDAQWNDDVHHVAHVLATGESDAYYAPYGDATMEKLVKALTTGFVWQGEVFPVWEDDGTRGGPSGHLPPTAFINFLQNHDQIGNRALGERLAHLARPEAVAALQALFLLAPQIPMLYMGEEYGAPEPFLFFTDFEGELADAVREGRRREFKGFAAFASEEGRERIPDPNDRATFTRSRLDPARRQEAGHRAIEERTAELLAIRAEAIVPRLAGLRDGAAEGQVLHETGLRVRWTFPDGARLEVLANLGDAMIPAPAVVASEDMYGHGRILFATHPGSEQHVGLPGWSVLWRLTEAS
ncbi:malto-oligosyltrehalose trehalohydrolase [Marinivivus vitaminiproducens]|uniref:malto-oligosyltrehalose trehalohydrolase n=1 Tax=Marinivivus vitaminiproducens TaxID=3035935 RepID=UPI00279CFF6E|nr:malto-oligosyltrehalose trehalohydrolase [Geminicoccaceae bacterium SCSIO 64248]